jgi:hypothetical protein
MRHSFEMEKAAIISPCRLYRYQLARIWDDSLPRCLFAGLNPSKADGSQDDPTVRRMIGFARDWGYGGLFVVNLFAFRATDPKDMKAAIDPIGPENDDYIRRLTAYCDITIAAWGCHGDHLGRAERVVRGSKICTTWDSRKTATPAIRSICRKTRNRSDGRQHERSIRYNL